MKIFSPHRWRNNIAQHQKCCIKAANNNIIKTSQFKHIVKDDQITRLKNVKNKFVNTRNNFARRMALYLYSAFIDAE
jgi:hypothetical protein